MALEHWPWTQAAAMDLWTSVGALGGLWLGGLESPRFRKRRLSPDFSPWYQVPGGTATCPLWVALLSPPLLCPTSGVCRWPANSEASAVVLFLTLRSVCLMPVHLTSYLRAGTGLHPFWMFSAQGSVSTGCVLSKREFRDTGGGWVRTRRFKVEGITEVGDDTGREEEGLWRWAWGDRARLLAAWEVTS